MRVVFITFLLYALPTFTSIDKVQKADSIKADLPRINDSDEAEALLELLLIKRDSFQLNAALQYGYEALSSANLSKNESLISKCYNELGVVYRLQGKNDSALIYFEEALLLREKLDDRKGIAGTLSYMGVAYRKQKRFDEATSCFLTAIEIYQELKDEDGIGGSLNNISILYAELQDHEKSLDFIKLYLEHQQRLKDSTGMAKAYNNMGLAYRSLGQYDLAMDCYQKSLKIKTKHNDWGGMMTTHTNMADLCVVMKDYDCALKYYQRVISDWNIKPTSINIIKVHRNIGKVYALLKQYKTAEDYLLKALEMTKKSSRVENKEMVLLSLVELYKEQEFYKEALYYLEKHEYILDSSLVAIGQQEMNRMDAIYQLEKEEQSYRFEEEKKVFRNRIYSYSIIVLLVILLIYLLGQYRSKRKANKALMVEKEKAQESDRLKSAFLANMSHEIRTPMNAILGFTDLLRDPELTRDELSNYVDVIEDGGQRMLTIINDLVDISKIEAGIIDISYSKIEVNAQIESVGYLLHNEAIARGLELIITKNKEALLMNTDQEKLQAILLNLVKNAMKFTPSGSVEVGYCCNDNEVNFFVKDTGVGIAEDKKEVIFERFVQAEKHKLTEGTGLGLSISKAYVEMLGGRIGFSSEIDKGSTFYFTIPRNM